MRRAFRALVALLLALTAAVSLLPSAEPATRYRATWTHFTPRTGVMFNNTDGTRLQQRNILNYLGRTVDSTPPRSVVRIAVYSFFDQILADKLTRARRRGVVVQVLVDGHTTSPQIRQLARVLGRDTRAKSFLKVCRYACMSDSPQSMMHAKMFMFSTAGRAKRVLMIGSGNPNRIGHDHGWNNHNTIVGNDALYLSSVQYFADMVSDRTVPNYYRTTESGPYKLYFFPRAGSGVKNDTMYDVLSAVHCGAVEAGGARGRTTVKVSMFLWTTRRLALAEQLWRLHDQGCDVQVAYPSNSVERSVVAALLRPSLRYGRMKLYDTLRDRDHDGIFESYVHSKYVVVDGSYGTELSTAAVWAGSANFSETGMRKGNEVTLKISGRTVTNQYEANFARIRSVSKLVTQVPPARKTNARSSDGELDVLDDYGR